MSDVSAAAGLAGFLLERIAEDEACCVDESRKRAGQPYFYADEATAFEQHFTPRRVLADLDAKRRIVELHTDGQDRRMDPECDFYASTVEVRPVLRWMVEHSEIGVAGRGGAWVRYRQHRHGEVNR